MLAATALLWAPLRIRREPIVPCGNESSASAWAEQLKGQTIIEDTMSGKGERAAMVEQQHQRIMEHMTHDPQVQGVNTGMYNTSAMMHQYGAAGRTCCSSPIRVSSRLP